MEELGLTVKGRGGEGLGDTCMRGVGEGRERGGGGVIVVAGEEET
jgi:hypothetical protein